jgi:hypothetical protein
VTHPWRPIALLAVIAVGIAAVAVGGGELRDVDVFWHTRVGNELLAGINIYEIGRDWTYAPVPGGWVSTQWIVEILFSLLHRAFDWTGLIGFRIVTTAAALTTVGIAVFNKSRSWAAVLAFLPSAFTLIIFAQERPQQISFVLLPLVGLWWVRVQRDANPGPHPLIILAICAVWANCHGAWIMVPVVIALAWLGLKLDRSSDTVLSRRLVWSFLAALIGGSITPIGPLNLLVPIKFSASTSAILEWEPTSFYSFSTAGLTLTLGLIVVAWATRRAAISRSERFYVLALGFFGAMAGRNVTPAVLLLAAVLAWRLSETWQPSTTEPPDLNLTKALQPVTAIVVVAGIIFGGVTVARSVPIPPDSRPIGLVALIAEQSGPQRVLNSYNVSGLILWYGRDEPMQVGIDGRADRYGGPYIDQYLDMQKGRVGWNSTVEELQPTIGLIADKDPLVPLLTLSGWTVIAREAEHVLLLPPTPPQPLTRLEPAATSSE